MTSHKDSYTTPEFRRIKAIELSPQSLGSGDHRHRR